MLASVHFSDEFSLGGLQLLELPDAVLAALEAGEEVSFKGEAEDDMMVCTESATYDVKFADTSNTVFLVPESTRTATSDDDDGDGDGDDGLAGLVQPTSLTDKDGVPGREFGVEGRVTAFLELTQCAPRLGKLRRLLSGDDKDAMPRHTTEELLDRVQASRDELMVALDAMNAVLVDGAWQLVHFDTTVEVLFCVVNACDAQMTVEECCEYCQGELQVPPAVTRAIIGQFSPDSAGDAEDAMPEQAAGEIKLCSRKICRFRALEVMQMATEFSLDAFMECWKDKCGEDTELDMALLRGLALVVDTGVSKVVVPFQASALPEAPRERFKALFAQKTVWSEEDITPYLTDLEGHGLTVAKLLFKFARCFPGPGGEKLYNRR